ncbi:Mth938-like domain-containing protein [Coralloluteibacterium thermophilus]|uniref:Mth938-like domain-containing protein n=1 Tax=Coralloluteibacterium thermophilum TaxID=2707049 RepID=A0ABV9NNZ3_9GAMM
MQLTLEQPDSSFVLRGTGPGRVLVNQRTLTRSFIVSADRLLEDWPPGAPAELEPGHMDAALDLGIEVLVLGTGDRLRFPSQAVMAACLTRGVGIEVMDNAAAARTFNVLVGEGRRAAAAFLIERA